MDLVENRPIARHFVRRRARSELVPSDALRGAVPADAAVDADHHLGMSRPSSTSSTGRPSAHAELARIAARRSGVVTVAEASDIGLTRAQLRTLLRRGDWSSPVHGVLVAAAATPSWEQRCAIAVMSARGVLSHRAAAQMHGLDGIEDAPVELSVPRRRAQVPVDATVHRATLLEPVDITEVSGIPVTSVARTLVDLGEVVDDDVVEKALDAALRQGFSQRWVVQVLERLARPGTGGPGSMRRVLARPDRRGPLPDSTFERLVERGCVDIGLPAPVRQHVVLDRDGQFVARLDVAWPELGIGVEAHSRRWHFGDANARADQHRANRLAALGWLVIFIGWADVDHPTRFVEVLRDAHETRASQRPG